MKYTTSHLSPEKPPSDAALTPRDGGAQSMWVRQAISAGSHNPSFIPSFLHSLILYVYIISQNKDLKDLKGAESLCTDPALLTVTL